MTMLCQAGSVCRWGEAQAFLAVPLNSQTATPPPGHGTQPQQSPPPPCLTESQPVLKGKESLRDRTISTHRGSQQRAMGVTNGTGETHSKMGTVPKVVASSSLTAGLQGSPLLPTGGK